MPFRSDGDFLSPAPMMIESRPWAYREFGSKGTLVKFEYILHTEKFTLSVGITL